MKRFILIVLFLTTPCFAQDSPDQWGYLLDSDYITLQRIHGKGELQLTRELLDAFKIDRDMWREYAYELSDELFECRQALDRFDGHICWKQPCYQYLYRIDGTGWDVTPPSCYCPDLNGDCTVDDLDFKFLMSCQTGPCIPARTVACLGADLDGDGDIDQDDFGIMQRSLGMHMSSNHAISGTIYDNYEYKRGTLLRTEDEILTSQFEDGPPAPTCNPPVEETHVTTQSSTDAGQ